MVRPRWTWLIVGLIAGALGILVVCGVEYALGWLHPLAIQLGPRSGVPRILFVLAVFIPSIGVGFTEELAFRGYAFQTLAERGPIWVAALVSTLLWAGLHFTLGGFGVGFVLSVTAMGIVFVILRLLSGSLWLPIGFHAAWDFTQTYVMGVATTGSGPHDPALLPVSQTGPALWVGSAPSIEGGMLYLILMLLILAGLVIFMRASGRRLSRLAA
jgi:membrane protease YdiL (CAAX protease family)